MNWKKGVFILSLFLVSCLSPPDVPQERADTFYQYMNDENYDGMLSLLNERWLEEQSVEESKTMFININKNLGKVEKHGLLAWHTKTVNMIIGGGGGNTYTLVYNVTRENQLTKETFVIFNEEDSNIFTILSYNVGISEFQNQR